VRWDANGCPLRLESDRADVIAALSLDELASPDGPVLSSPMKGDVNALKTPEQSLARP
jgi:hypothetical protein